MNSARTLSMIIPFFNEAESAGVLVTEVVDVLNRLGIDYEVLLIDDGSSDGTREVLRSMQAQFSRCRVLHHERNAGQAAALWTGFHAATGTILGTLDGDGQNDPADVPRMLQLLDNADMVIGIRAGRQDSALRKAMSRIANGVRSRWLGDGVSDTGCAIKVFRKEVVETFLPVRTLYSFLPAFAVSGGFRVIECPVNHRPRRFGRSSYGLIAMLWRPSVDMLAIGWLMKRRIPKVVAAELPNDSEPGR